MKAELGDKATDAEKDTVRAAIENENAAKLADAEAEVDAYRTAREQIVKILIVLGIKHLVSTREKAENLLTARQHFRSLFPWAFPIL